MSPCRERMYAIIKIMPDGAVISRGNHAPGCMCRNGIDLSRAKEATILNNDVKDPMHQWVEEHSVSSDHSHQTPEIIWQNCFAHFCESFGGSFSLSSFQACLQCSSSCVWIRCCFQGGRAVLRQQGQSIFTLQCHLL